MENYEDVAPWDLILWSRVGENERESKCPSLYRLVDRYYEIGHFVATTIVSEPEVEDRVEMICKFLDVTRCANDLGNFNLMMAIYSGITHPVLKRMKSTWSSMPSEKMKLLNSFIKYCDPEDNYDAMRTYVELTSTVRPCLPFLGGYLAEMSSIHSLSSDYLPSISSSGERLINYAKHRKLYSIISSIRRCNAKLAVRRREQIVNAIRRLHALPTDGIKLKVADLQEASSWDVLETSETQSDSMGEHGFEAVATPRYPVFDPMTSMRGFISPDTLASPILTDSSPHELFIDGTSDVPRGSRYTPSSATSQSHYGNNHATSAHSHHQASSSHATGGGATGTVSPHGPNANASPSHAPSATSMHSSTPNTASPQSATHHKKSKKGEILKSKSAGAFNIAKLGEDGGSASSSGGDSNRHKRENSNQSGGGSAGGSGSSPQQIRTTKTSSDGALNKRVLLKNENDTYYYYTTASGPSSTKSQSHNRQTGASGNSQAAPSSSVAATSSGNMINMANVANAASKEQQNQTEKPQSHSGGQKSSAPISTTKRQSNRSVTSANSRGSLRSGISGDGEDDMSDGGVGHAAHGGAGATHSYVHHGPSSYGSHSHLYHSGGGHISAGTSPKDFISPFGSTAVSPTFKKELTPLRFPQNSSSTTLNHDAIAESDDSPRSLSSGSSPSIHKVPNSKSSHGRDSASTTSRQNNRQNHSPVRRHGDRTTSAPSLDRISDRNTSGSTIVSGHSNPASARSAGAIGLGGKGSASIMSPAAAGGVSSNSLGHGGSVASGGGAGPGTSPGGAGGSNFGTGPGGSPGGASGSASLAAATSLANKAELKMDTKRYRIALELLETEEDFVHYLKILVEDGIWSLRQRLQKEASRTGKTSSNSSQLSSTNNNANTGSTGSPPLSPHSPHSAVSSSTAITEEHLRIIFSNIEALYSFHSLLLEDLHNAVRFWRSGGLGSLFSQYHHGFEAYVEYTNTRHRGDLLLEALLDLPAPSTRVEDGGLSAARLLQRQQEVILSKTRKANFHALLHLPVLRLPRILILLKEFKACTSEGYVDLPILVDAISKLENIAMKLPMTQEDAEQSMLQLQVLNKITGWKDKRSKLRPGRAFLAEYDLKMLIQGTNRFPKLVALLWSDTIFFCRTKETRGTKKRKWAILGVLNLTHVHLHPLSAKQVRQKFKELSKEHGLGGTGGDSGTPTKGVPPTSSGDRHHQHSGRPSWNKHPSIVSMKYLGLEWLLSFASVELGDAFVADVHAARERVVSLHSTRFTNFEVGQTSPGACESAAIARVASKVYSFGGAFRGQWRNEMWAWDMEDRKWEKVIPNNCSNSTANSASFCEPPLARTEHALCAVGTKLYLHGGQRFGSYIDDMMVFDTETKTWAAIALQPPMSSQYSTNTHSLSASSSSIHSLAQQQSNVNQGSSSSNQNDSIERGKTDLSLAGTSSSSLATTTTYVTADGGPSLPGTLMHPITKVSSGLSVTSTGTNSNINFLNAQIPVSSATAMLHIPEPSTPPSPRSGHSLNAIGTKLYLFGGQWFESLHQRHLFNDLYCFDTETSSWQEILPTSPEAYVPAPRQRHAAQVIDNKLIVFGGSGLTSELSDTAIYDPVTNTWQACEDAYGYIPTNRALIGSTVFGKKLILFGGACEAMVSSSSNTNVSPSSSSILTVTQAPSAQGGVVQNTQGTILTQVQSSSSPAAASSSPAVSETYNDLFVFDVEAMKWSHCWVPVELFPRRAHSIVATSSNDNTLTIMCGRMLDPSTGESKPTEEVLLLHGLSSIINNSVGRAEKMEKMREKVHKLSQFAIHQQALLTVVGSHYVTPPPTSEGVKWDPLTTKSTFTLLENLGSLVYKAIHEPTQSLVAIKVLSHHDCSLEMLDIMAEEMQILSRCRHPGLTAYHGFAPVSSELWIVSELALGASLDRIQQETTTLTEKQVASLLVTLLESLAYLHSQSIVHKSIKASNVVLNADGRIKLTDWGLSPVWKPFHSSPSPAASDSGAHTAASDIYDLGLMVVGLLEHYGPARQLRTRNRFAAETLDFVALCTASFAHRRPTAVQLLSHPFVLPHLQNAQRDDVLRSLFSDAASKNGNRRSQHISLFSTGQSSSPALSLLASSSFATTIDRTPIESRRSSGGPSLAQGNQNASSSANTASPLHGSSSRRKLSKAEDDRTAILMAHIEDIKIEHASETEMLKQTILTLQAQNSNLESRLRAIELLVSNLVIPQQ